MTPDRYVGDSVLDARTRDEVAREAPHEAMRVAIGDVPAPRPEVLARVLEGLRDLPVAPPEPAADVAGDAAATPLPRRRA